MGLSRAYALRGRSRPPAAAEHRAPMHLLEPRRIVQDEGLGRALMVAFNVLRDPIARRRVRAMRSAFRKYRQHLGAITLVAIRPPEDAR